MKHEQSVGHCMFAMCRHGVGWLGHLTLDLGVVFQEIVERRHGEPN